MSRADFISQITSRVRDTDSRLEPADYERALKVALIRLDGDRPRYIAGEVVADETDYLPQPEHWDDEFSKVRSVEFPIDEKPQTLLSQDDWNLIVRYTGKQVIVYVTHEIDDTFRLMFSVRHEITDAPEGGETTNTVPLQYQSGLVDYAASYLLAELATYYASDSDSTISADSVDRQSKSQRYASRARALEQNYFDAVGVAKKHNKHACATGNMSRRRKA